jgi:hypothetical protein
MPWAAAALSPVIAATFYVSSDAKSDGDGSMEKPFASVEGALAKTGGGHTIVVRPGLYRGPIEIPRQYAGTKESPTVIRSEVKWKAIIVGAPVHAISNGGECHWVTIDGFQVQGARYDGIKMNGDHNVVRNCWVHNNQAMPETDFWGRSRAKDRPPDLGAMPFLPELADPAARQRFEFGWAYFRHGSGGTIPDLWLLPDRSP